MDTWGSSPPKQYGSHPQRSNQYSQERRNSDFRSDNTTTNPSSWRGHSQNQQYDSYRRADQSRYESKLSTEYDHSGRPYTDRFRDQSRDVDNKQVNNNRKRSFQDLEVQNEQKSYYDDTPSDRDQSFYHKNKKHPTGFVEASQNRQPFNGPDQSHYGGFRPRSSQSEGFNSDYMSNQDRYKSDNINFDHQDKSSSVGFDQINEPRGSQRASLDRFESKDEHLKHERSYPVHNFERSGTASQSGSSAAKTNPQYNYGESSDPYRSGKERQESSKSYLTDTQGSFRPSTTENFVEPKQNNCNKVIEEKEETLNIPTTSVMSNSITDDLSWMVVLFYYNNNNKYESNLYNIINESFLLSDISDKLITNEKSNCIGGQFLCCCTLSWKGKELAQGEGGSSKYAREIAALQLINKLAMTCYTVKARDDYFSYNSFQNLLDEEELPGVYRVVPKEEVPTIVSAYGYIDKFFQKEKDVELVFGGEGYSVNNILGIKMYAEKQNYSLRMLFGHTYLAISYKHSPQYIRDNLLKGGTMSHKFELLPPQGIGNNLLKDIHCSGFLPSEEVKNPMPTDEGKWGFLPINKTKARRRIKGRMIRHGLITTMEEIEKAVVEEGMDYRNMEEFANLPRRKRNKLLKIFQSKGIDTST